MISKTTHSIHFEDFSGIQFERLVFAFLLRAYDWETIDWVGASGADSGRDICGTRIINKKNSLVYYQCANHRQVSLTKISKDISKIVNSSYGIPNSFVVVSGGNVSSKLKTKISELCKSNNINHCEVWTGKEFEERIRATSEGLIKRFVEGIEFPDIPSDIMNFMMEIPPQTDDEILSLMIGIFDRPVFYTRFSEESSLLNFVQAINDSIEALNTGIHKLRDGSEIRRIPSKYAIKSQEIKNELDTIVILLNTLRSAYTTFIKSGDIKLCSCGKDDCPVHILSYTACINMDSIRKDILRRFNKIYPKFKLNFY